MQIEKYKNIRANISSGSIALFRGSSALSKTIQWADSAYYNHSALVLDFGGRLMVLDANASGVKPDFLSVRISEYVDFDILKPVGFNQQFIDEAVNKAIDKDLAKDYKYDFALLPKILVNKKLGLPVNHRIVDTNKTICSVFTGFHYASFLNYYPYINIVIDKGYITPQDHIRHNNGQFKILK